MIKFLDLKKVNQEYQPALTSAVQRVSESGSYIRGQEVSAFEGDYASYTGSKNCVGVGNGFDALRLIFKAWLISGVMKEGDEVIVPANTYIASILAITDNRLVPVLCEPDIHTYNIDSSLIVRKISSRTRAILLVHLYGRNSFSEGIRKIAAENNLRVIEDNAQAAGCARATSLFTTPRRKPASHCNTIVRRLEFSSEPAYILRFFTRSNPEDDQIFGLEKSQPGVSTSADIRCSARI